MGYAIGSMMVIHKENMPNLAKLENKIQLRASSTSIGEIGGRPWGVQCSGGSANRGRLFSTCAKNRAFWDPPSPLVRDLMHNLNMLIYAHGPPSPLHAYALNGRPQLGQIDQEYKQLYDFAWGARFA